nr:SOS response-associated peptidase family protein [uncultured Flavobacterium sp.]
MCFYSKQTKAAKAVENRFKAKIEKIALFQPKENINGFDFAFNPIITDEQPEVITHYNWGLIPSWSKDEEIKKVFSTPELKPL